MQLGEIMTVNTETISPNTTLQEAARKMALLNVGMFPVIEGNQVVGVITDRDITVRGIAQNLDPAKTPVQRTMTQVVVCGSADQDVEDGARLMREHQIRRLPIIDRGKRLVGIVSLADLVTGAADKDLAAQVLGHICAPAPVREHV